MRDLIGRTLGHYRVVEKIGEGGMGEVYRAHDEKLDRDVAIKVLPEAVTQDAERLARFETEAKAVAKLTHPNILDLKNFASQQEIYHGDNYTYANNVAVIPEMTLSDRVNLQVNEAAGRGWAAVAWHDAVPTRQCGIFYGSASAANASPATTAGVIACVE